MKKYLTRALAYQNDKIKHMPEILHRWKMYTALRKTLKRKLTPLSVRLSTKFLKSAHFIKLLTLLVEYDHSLFKLFISLNKAIRA